MKTQAPERASSARESAIERVLDDCWRLTPARMAERLTGGRFQRYRHVRFLENRLARAIGRGGARLLITMPPRHGKSWLASLFTPAWFLSLWPDRSVILSSHDAGVAAAWGRGVRDFLREHRAELAVRPCDDRIVTAGVGGPINGNGGHLLIVDDPLKRWTDALNDNRRQKQIEWFNSSLCTRAEPGASIVVIMTRWHEGDLAGYLEARHGDSWEVLRIPAVAEEGDTLDRPPGAALCEERFGLEALGRIRRNVGSRVWDALYQQRPSSEKGALLKRAWWKYYDASPARFDDVVQSWDLAVTDSAASDYVVGQVWGRLGTAKFLIDQVREKLDFPATIRAVQRLSDRHPQTTRTLIEARANGCAVSSVLRDRIPGLILVQPDGGKLARTQAVSGEVEAGNVYLPAPGLTPWAEEFLSECSDFPNGRHDDQVDAMAYALNHWRKEKLNARTQCAGSTDLSDLESVGRSSSGFFGR